MSMHDNNDYDAIIVGSGPNGLSAAITMAREGCRVLLLEAKDTVGGGMRSEELTLPGFVHDVCSAIHPLAAASPFFRMLNLEQKDLEWIFPPAALAHPLNDGTAAVLRTSIKDTVQTLGEDDKRYARLMERLTAILEDCINDLPSPLGIPKHPLATLRFGWRGLLPAASFARRWFRGEHARGLFAGISAHAIAPLEHWTTAAFGLLLGAAGHLKGWPLVKGGSQKLADTMAQELISLGGTIETSFKVNSLSQLPKARAVLFDLSPRHLDAIVADRFPSPYRQCLQAHRHGPGSFKLDWALDGTIPWKAEACLEAGTVHVGGTLSEIAASERAVWRGAHPERPFVLVVQQSLFDSSRVPEGKQPAWGYCHVPNGSSIDMTERIENQIERFAPGFRDKILFRSVMSTRDIEEYNPNYIGGDIAGGALNPWGLFVRPLGQWKPYATPLKGIYLCSASTPPGGGVHGMCGYHAARLALRELF
jgi:phytoene dehydrogenase-like protein